MHLHFSIFTVAVFGAALAACSGAETGTSTAQSGVSSADEALPPEPPPKPPQEAFDACESASEGDSCSVTFDGQAHDGKCIKGPDGAGPLACAPPRPPPPQGHRGPPKEAIAACANLSAGDACQIQLGDEAHAGTCATGPDGELPVACRPDDLPPPPPPPPPPSEP